MNILRKIFPIFFSIFSLIFFFYIFYKSEIYWDSSLINGYYNNYYIISIILLIISSILFFVNNIIKDYIIIFSVSIVISLYLFEIYLLSTQYNQNNISKYKLNKFKEVTNKNYDTRSKIEVYRELKKNEDRAAVTVYPFTNINKKKDFFPLSGLSHANTIYCNENGYFSSYKSDRYGFNNPDSEWDKNEIEYLLLGDSFTHGACVNRPYDIGSALRVISGKSVLNLGYAGNGPLIEYATFREYMRPNIKKVIFLYFEENDLFNLHNELSNKILKKYLDDTNFSQNLKLRQKDVNLNAIEQINQTIKSGSEISSKIKFIKFLKLRNLRNLIKGTSIPKPAPDAQFKEILKQIKKITIKNKSEFLFVYLPEIKGTNSNYTGDSYNMIKNILKDLDIKFIDMQKVFFNSKNEPKEFIPFLFDSGVHYNKKGYQKVAETIFYFSR